MVVVNNKASTTMTFSPVVKPAAIRTIFSLAVSQKWHIHQLDAKSAFLHGHLTETVYMHQPSGFTDSAHSDYVCLLILERAHMLNCNPYRILVDTEKKLGPERSPVNDPTLYRSLAGALQYLTFTRPDLSYAVQQFCLYMHDPREPHLNAMKRDTLSHSSAEAEYRGVVNAVAETSWVHNLLRELNNPLSTATLVYSDNVSVVYMSANPVQNQRTKHIEIDLHFVCDKVAAGHVQVLHDPSRFQYAEIFTKGLPYPLFADFRSSLSVSKSPAPTAGEY
ncbi:ribonuclease H-like domain-containing protein [Tanacetum coccineum]